MAAESRGGWPWRRSLPTRIVLSYGALFAVVLIVLMAWVGRIVYVAQRDAVVHGLERQALLAADALQDPLSGFSQEFEQESRRLRAREGERREEHGEREKSSGRRPRPAPPTGGDVGVSRLPRVAAAYAASTGGRVVILDEQGAPIADSLTDGGVPARRLSEAEARAYARRESLSTIGADPASGLPALLVTAPVISGQALHGFVQFIVPLGLVTQRIWALLLTLAGFGACALAVSGLVGVVISRRLVKPIRGLERASLAMAAGDLSQRVPVDEGDEIGALARAFNHMADQVQAVVAQQRAFVANASHELRTPLTNIKLRSEALLASPDDPVLQARYLRDIEQESDRLARLADTLLDLARMEEASAGVPAGPVDPTAVIERVCELIAARADNAGIRFEAQVAEPLPAVRVTGDGLETVLLNLLDNAVKYTPSGGAVRFAATATDGWLSVEIRDSGQGIPAEDLPHVFERFYRADKARTRGRAVGGMGGGVGLGLALVRQLVDRCGGHIEIASAEGAGTTVMLSLPVADVVARR